MPWDSIAGLEHAKQARWKPGNPITPSAIHSAPIISFRLRAIQQHNQRFLLCFFRVPGSGISQVVQEVAVWPMLNPELFRGPRAVPKARVPDLDPGRKHTGGNIPCDLIYIRARARLAE